MDLLLSKQFFPLHFSSSFNQLFCVTRARVLPLSPSSLHISLSVGSGDFNIAHVTGSLWGELA